MSDIRSWLDNLELGEYAEAFEFEKVALEDLSEINDAELKELGLPLGPRKRLLRAAAQLRSEDDAKDDNKTVPVEPDLQSHAERRHLTVMFCDLVGSTALSERLDPEELRSVMQAYRKACNDVVVRYEGHVAQYLGDGIMAYFGWPRAHEDDAARAVRSGLDIVAAIDGLQSSERLKVRVGIATGLVVVGDNADDGSDDGLAVGDTPNLAARTQALAKPGTVTIAGNTRQLLGDAFELEGLGVHEAKGVTGGLHVHRVRRAARTESRFEAMHAAGLTPLVGRENEIAMLLERWDQAKDGEGQVVLLSGEAGIGKSRVTQVLRERIAGEAHTRIRYQCSPYYTNSAFYPVIEQMERAAGITRDDSTDIKLDKLEAVLAQSSSDMTLAATLIAAMLSLPIDRYPALNLSPQRQKDDTISALTAQIVALAKTQPVLMLFEDAHWCDPSTIEALSSVISAIEDRRVLLVITHRPEFESPWPSHGHVSAQNLQRLRRKHGAEMVARVTRGKALPDEVLSQIVEETDGVPLFVEELTKTVLDAGFLTEHGNRFSLDGPLPPLAIPATLQDSLMARLDRHSAVKEVAQIGACIGREFTFELLAAVSDSRNEDLQDLLRLLSSSGLVSCRGTPPDATYSFKHALVQDAAYESLLKSKRQQYHAAIGRALRDSLGGLVKKQPQIIARHFTEADMVDTALPYWLVAGQSANRRAAFAEAMQYLNTGLELVSGIAPGDERNRAELEFLLALAPVCYHKMGPTSWVYQRAGELRDSARNRDEQFRVALGLHIKLLVEGNAQAAYERASELQNLAGADPAKSLIAETILGEAAMMSGNFKIALKHGIRTCNLLDAERDRDIVFDYGYGISTAFTTVAWCSWSLGLPDQARRAANQALQLAFNESHPQDLLYCLVHVGADLHSCMGLEPERIGEYAEQAIELGAKLGDPWRLAIAHFHRGWSRMKLDDPMSGRKEMEQAISDFRASGVRALLARFTADLALVFGETGDPDGGLQLIDDMQAERDVRHAEIYRKKGELYLMTSPPNLVAAEQCFNEALDIARKEDNKSLELRAAMSMARMWSEQGERRKAYDLLFPVYDWFTEGFDTPDLKNAKVLLVELG